MFKRFSLIFVGATSLFVGCQSTKAQVVEEKELYNTSFEKSVVGKFATINDKNVVWKESSQAEITDKFAKTGKKSLRIFGGEECTVELELKGELQSARGISFWAERWSSSNPFKFRILAQVNGNWKEVSNLDKIVQTGARFRSEVFVALPDEIIGGVRLVCTAPEGKGVLVDDFKFLKGKPVNVSKAPEVATEKIRKIVENKALFVSGTENTHTFRIPAIITALNGDLIACCDARRQNAGDLIWVKDIDIVLKRSSDNGKTWTDMETVIDYGGPEVGKPASDPSFILDRTTGELFCFYNFMDQINAKKEFRLHVQSSKDHGKTWSEPRDITDQISKPEWKMDFKFITSGRGTQTRDGELLHTLVNLKHGVHLFGSKDHGKSWYLKETPIKPADESKVLELADGSLMVNARVGGGFRWVHRSDDDGKTWTSKADKNLVDPRCNGVIIRYTSKADGYKKNRLLFCNANSFSGRKNLTVKISYDEGKTWSKGKVIDPGASAYSDMTICKDGSIGILYEPGYGEVRFTRITLEDLTDGKDSLSKPYSVSHSH